MGASGVVLMTEAVIASPVDGKKAIVGAIATLAIVIPAKAGSSKRKAFGSGPDLAVNRAEVHGGAAEYWIPAHEGGDDVREAGMTAERRHRCRHPGLRGRVSSRRAASCRC
jgi:hypothetical protein